MHFIVEFSCILGYYLVTLYTMFSILYRNKNFEEL